MIAGMTIVLTARKNALAEQNPAPCANPNGGHPQRFIVGVTTS